MSIYTHGHHESVLRSHQWRTAENSAGYLLPHLRPGMSLLDVGSGPGSITHDLARRVGPAGRVIGIDTSADVVELARAAAEEQGVRNVVFEVADVLEFDAGPFDVVVAHQVLQHVGDPVAVLRAMRGLARSGGLVSARDADFAAMTWYPRLGGIASWLEAYRGVARGNGGEPDAGRELLAWGREAGLGEITSSASAWCFATREDRSWWGGLWADRILESGLGEQMLAASLARPEDLERMAADWRAWAEDDDAWFGVLHGEIVAVKA